MKQELIQIYNILDQVGVTGQKNVFALANALNMIMNIINKLEKEEQNKPISIDNTKEKE
jgi:hypothetical protein